MPFRENILIYSRTTKDIKVSTTPIFIDISYDGTNYDYVWSYDIVIQNNSNFTIQVINRYWEITGSDGKTQTVQGVGVVGKKPIILPSESFGYSSKVNLNTNSGFMSGKYTVINKANNESFEIDIPAFSLDMPNKLVTIN